MALLATLEGLGVPTSKRSGIFGACLGACDAVGATVAGCLGGEGSAYDVDPKKMVRDLPYGVGVNKLTDNAEKGLAVWGTKDVQTYRGPAKFMDTDIWDIPGRQLQSFGVDPAKYTLIGKWWFFPISMYLTIYSELYNLYQDVTTEERAAIAYYNYLGKFFEPADSVDANIYKYKLNVLKEFLNNMGLRNAWVKVEAEISRAGQAATAAKQASAAAKAYAAAMERQKQEAAKIEDEKQAAKIEIKEDVKKTGGDVKTTTSSGSSLLPLLGLAAAAAVAFIG